MKLLEKSEIAPKAKINKKNKAGQGQSDRSFGESGQRQKQRKPESLQQAKIALMVEKIKIPACRSNKKCQRHVHLSFGPRMPPFGTSYQNDPGILSPYPRSNSVGHEHTRRGQQCRR